MFLVSGMHSPAIDSLVQASLENKLEWIPCSQISGKLDDNDVIIWKIAKNVHKYNITSAIQKIA